MTAAAVEALRADRSALIDICHGLSDAEWEATCGWSGWSVHGLVSHLAGAFWLIVDRSAVPDTTGLPSAEAQDAIVDSRRTWSRDRVIDDYTAVSETAIGRLARLDGREQMQSFGDLGTYPVSMVPNSFAFDHYTHIRADLFAPRGPLTAEPPASDGLRLLPALDWISAALPQQNAALVDLLSGSLVIDVHGVGARRITVGSGNVIATVESDAPSLIRWITHRASWEEAGVSATGDAPTLDLARQLQVA
jgi:uncharacterized damage-inducible protein DinB